MQRENDSVRIVRNVCANMEAEGFRVTVSTRRDCQAIAERKQSADELVRRRIVEHRQNERV